MYHYKVTTSVILALLTTVFVQAPQPAWSLNKKEQKVQYGSVSQHELPVLPGKSGLKKRPQKVELYQLDNSPLNGRRPLLLVHGLRGECQEGLRWTKVIKESLSSPTMKSTYKVYLARYDSLAPLDKSTKEFNQEFLRFFRANSKQPVTVVAISMGGNLIQRSMLDSEIDKAVSVVISLGTPFHGSPLFSSDWFKYGIKKSPYTLLSKATYGIAYHYYFEATPNLIKELRWDNSDETIPNIGKFKYWLPVCLSGNLTPIIDENEYLNTINDDPRIDKTKFITYSGYLVNPYIRPAWLRVVDQTVLRPLRYATTNIPANAAREHPVLRLLNNEISKVHAKTENSEKLSRRQYILNDGITPVSSAIFLSNQALKSLSPIDESKFNQLRRAIDVRRARIFRNIDHVTFLDGYTPAFQEPTVKDELSPEEGKKTVFQWLAQDLLNPNSGFNQVASETDSQSPMPVID